jgi:hypothetical protein
MEVMFERFTGVDGETTRSKTMGMLLDPGRSEA